MKYEVIVVGGGHAGCEAALATSRKGHKTILITGNINNIADMPCNPSIGGSAKGIVVREIDALGGEMGINTDKTHIQIKMLNASKGPAVRSLRTQADKITYPKSMRKTLTNTKNLTIKEDLVEDLIITNNKIIGVITKKNQEILGDRVILTTGTYLKSDVLIGDERKRSGPNNEEPSNYLSDNLKKYGFKIIRLKTGTPPRLDKKTINFSKLRKENGDSVRWSFSNDFESSYDIAKQEPCYLVYTNEKTHQIIKDNLKKSSMYGGYVEGVGPRYCPSIEDKIVRFSDKERHQLFLEPESLHYDDIYLQGLSTSMPREIQEQLVHSIEGLETAKILKYAYAIEYDAIYPTQIYPSLETKIISNLYTAGQVNGTSGYEEAAAQGLIAGINTALSLEGKDPLILKRNEAYIGVLIDDLTTKGTMEPYRLLTSRAEYRLLLRHDNADIRLREYGYKVGLISKERYENLLNKVDKIEKLQKILKKTKITPTKETNEYLKEINSSELFDGIYLIDLLKRPEINLEKIKKFIDIEFSQEIIEQVEIMVKYSGYIKKTNKEIEKMLKYENTLIPKNLNYDNIHNLASEAKQKLKEINPTSIGQAMRISGVNPADISILTVYIKRLKK